MKPYLLMLCLVLVTIFADYLLKLAADRVDSFYTWHFAGGAVLYGASAIGWVLAMKQMTLAGIGVAYSLMTVLLLTALGVLVFRETLTGRDMLGLGCAVAALMLMNRA